MDNIFYILLAGVIFWIYCLISVISNEFKGNNKIVWVLLLFLLPFSAILYPFIGKKQIVHKNDLSSKEGKGGEKEETFMEKVIVFISIFSGTGVASYLFHYIVGYFGIIPGDYFGNIGKFIIIVVSGFLFSFPIIILLTIIGQLLALLVSFLKTKEFTKAIIYLVIGGISFVFIGTGVNIYHTHQEKIHLEALVKLAQKQKQEEEDQAYREQMAKEQAYQKQKDQADLQRVENYINEGKYSKALKLCLPLAERNNVEAQFNAGLIYLKDGNTKNYANAFYWIQKSAMQGNKKAENAISRMYEMGIGVGKDLEKAREWYMKSKE